MVLFFVFFGGLEVLFSALKPPSTVETFEALFGGKAAEGVGKGEGLVNEF